MNKLLRYKNGLRVVVAPIPGVRSISAGFWVGVGSALESSDINGLSHFTEHMMFKGTSKLSPFDIANDFESYGANVNAFTGKEATCYYIKAVDEYFEHCFSTLSDLLFDSTFPAEELDKERKVIVEEINMVEDSPEDICFDLLADAAYGNMGVGRTILGSVENVLRFSGDDIRKFMRKYYSPSNIVIAFAGNITEEQADALVGKFVLSRFVGEYSSFSRVKNTFISGVYKERIKDFEQSNIALAFPSVSYSSAENIKQVALNVAFGGGMSSRLFQSVRERLGLAYSIFSSQMSYSDSGAMAIVLNISKENTAKALGAVKDEIDKLLDSGISDDELQRTKVQLKSSLAFSVENTQSIMSSIGKYAVIANSLFDIEDRIALIDSLNLDDINSFARKVLNYSQMSAAYVGKQQDADILEIFK